ncbi:dihydroxyacetone kinase subunit L [Candidatus Pelagibacter sp.]|jgi:dihydroxyacetone kinase-like protein|nr:dihydroxyacetone kinase subunit L [Candidatus Pelagibacter sp.]MDC0855730.1 dihydroxyacetone kinase subunit L [Candidatus Pelagibacter sp.]
MLHKKSMVIIFEKLLDGAKKYHDEFNTTDGIIGDGDLGITILNGIEEINKDISNFNDDLSNNFMLCSQSFVKKSGSSFGTLIAFAFMEISKTLKGKTQCDHKDIINIMDTALNTILNRGKTKLGDKTIADTLSLILLRLQNSKKNINYVEIFKTETEQALEKFKGKKILIGRARMFGEKTKNLNDPGMFALAKLTKNL